MTPQRLTNNSPINKKVNNQKFDIISYNVSEKISDYKNKNKLYNK